MTFLIGLLSDLLTWFISKGWSAISTAEAQREADQAAATAAEKAQSNLDQAKTGDDIDKATDSSLNNL